MLKTLLAQIKQYKKDSILALACTSLEVMTQLLLPIVIAAIIDKGMRCKRRWAAILPPPIPLTIRWGWC